MTMEEIVLHEEDMQEILAREFAIRSIEQNVASLHLDAERYFACSTWIQEAVRYAEAHVKPVTHDELFERMQTWDFYAGKSKTLHEEAVRMQKSVEFLRESFTFFLAMRYNFDPFTAPWTLSIEDKKLYRAEKR